MAQQQQQHHHRQEQPSAQSGAARRVSSPTDHALEASASEVPQQALAGNSSWGRSADSAAQEAEGQQASSDSQPSAMYNSQ